MSQQSLNLKSRGTIKWLESPLLSELPWLVHAFSVRTQGARLSMAGSKLGVAAQESGTLAPAYRRKFMHAIGASRFDLASLRQVHSAQVFHVRRGIPGGLAFLPCGLPPRSQDVHNPAGDALLTDQAAILLSVRVADCLPVLIADKARRAVAAVHAGWRGGVQRIIEKSVGEMRRTFGCEPRDLVAALGPSIRACCYEVGEEVVDMYRGRFVNSESFFHEAFPSDSCAAIREKYPLLFLSSAPPGHVHQSGPKRNLDLIAVARDQLLTAGLDPAKICVIEACTACRTDLFYSYRKEGSQAGRSLAVIGIRSAVKP